MKVFPLMISKTFMYDHPRKGMETYFRNKIMAGQGIQSAIDVVEANLHGEGIKGWRKKIHTMRTNYAYWARIAKEVNAGHGVLSLRQWSGSPYNRKRDGSKQVEFLQLTKIGIQEFKICKELGMITIDNKRVISIEEHSTVARNDGLSQQDFYDWFKLGRKETEGAIIHFTDFRY